MRILVFGKTGQVATELQRQVPPDVILDVLGRNSADLGDPEACAAAIINSTADMVINAAAYTAVDKAEEETGLATVINGEAPAAMARAAAAKGIPFIQISTDYVFDGSGQHPWAVDAPTGALGVYGRTKLLGEEGVKAAGGTHVILRTSWVFSAHGANFVKTMLRLSETRDQLSVVADQIGGPTAAADIAAACLTIARTLHHDGDSGGTFHFAGQPDVSWADFAREVFTQTRREVAVKDIPTSAYPTPAKRPENSRLDCTGLEAALGITRPDWRASLSDVLKELKVI